MRPRAVVVAKVAAQATTKVLLVEDMTWSSSSRRMVPISRSANAFCQGERGAVRNLDDANSFHSLPELRPVPKLERDDYERSREVGTERVKALQGGWQR